MSAKLSRKQIIEARKQAKNSREKEMEALREKDEDAYLEKIEKSKDKKDKLGFTREDRKKIGEKKLEINKPKVKVSWNFTEGELVYLPNGEVGIIVKNNAKDLELNYSFTNAAESINNYEGKVYVVTSSGNNWFYPKKLKPIR